MSIANISFAVYITRKEPIANQRKTKLSENERRKLRK